MENDYVLLVGEGRPVSDTARALVESHRDVKRCRGPAKGYCPALHGLRCDLRAEATASVVFFAGEHEFHAPGPWSCVMTSLRPAVAVVDGATIRARGSAGFSVVGSSEGPGGVIEALDKAIAD